MKRRRKIAPWLLTISSLAGLAATVPAVCLLPAAAAQDNGGKNSDADGSLSAAICPIVYRLDESPSTRGYHYTFFGNAFFINDQGYLLTAAHVLETFRNGGQPSILLARPNSPPQLLPITVIATDAEHEVAILRVTPNPFAAHYRVTFLSLDRDPAVPGRSVLALSLHPARPRSAQSFQLPVEDRSAGTVLSLETTQLEKSAPAAEVFLLSHPVTLGQSGSPVLAADSHAVVGLIEGRWVRGGSVSLARANGESADPPGAAVPIHYAIALLEEKGIAWSSVPRAASSPASQATGNAQPAPKP
jgi:trypsin-like peptidase